MDSLTQFTLGAAVSAVCLGKVMGPRKAVLVGGLLGTLPDLDVFLPVDNPVDAFVFHRGWTHSFFVHALAAPVIGEVLVRSFKALREHRMLVWMTVFLCFTTHAMIDAMTVYGTRIFWPFYPDPVGVGSVFIIDPLYTVPLLIGVIWALCSRSWTARLGKVLATALIFSTAYMGLSVVLQAQAEKRAKVIFANAGIDAKNVFAIAAPFNIVVWKVIGQEEDRYHNLYISLFDDDEKARLYSHATRQDLTACLENNDAFQKLKWFSRGYLKTALEDGKVIISDLRMGLTPTYVFRFIVADYNGGTITPTAPLRLERDVSGLSEDLGWLSERFWGRPAVRPAEANANGAAPVTEAAASC